MKGLFIPGITAEMFRNGCLENIDALMAEGEIYDIDYQRWIPVSERLPEEPYGCLVTVEDEEPMTGQWFENILPYFVGWDGERWNDAEGEQCPFEVIAWIPLPESYKAESDGKDAVVIDRNLCESCVNSECVFQSGIVRSHCDFYKGREWGVKMTIQEIKNTPEIVDFMLDKSVITESRIKLHKRLEEICELAIKALEQGDMLEKIKDEIKDNTYFINETTEKEGIDFETVEKIIDKYRKE